MLTYYFCIFRLVITNLYVELWKTFNFISCVMFTMCVYVSENLVETTIFKIHQIMSHLFTEIWLHASKLSNYWNKKDKLEVGIVTKTSHCHCSVASVPQDLKDICVTSWRKHKATYSSNKLKQTITELEKKLAETRKRKREETEEKDLLSFKTKVATRATLLPPKSRIFIVCNDFRYF